MDEYLYPPLRDRSNGRTVEQIRIDVESGRLHPFDQIRVSADLGRTPMNLLQWACLEGDFEIIQYLATEWGGDFEALMSAVDMKRRTPLHLACHASRDGIIIVKYLVEELHADITVTDRLGRTPLLHACAQNRYGTRVPQVAIVQYLVQCERPNGLDSRLSQPTDRDGRMALHLACESNRVDVVKALIENYSDEVDAQDRSKVRPLQIAVSNLVRNEVATEDIIFFLVAHAKADVNVTDQKGWTPIEHIYHADLDGTADLVRLFLDNGVEVEFDDEKGRTPLHFVSRRGDVQVVRHLVENKGAAVDLRDKWGYTSLHLACESGMIEVVRYLLRHHADANAKNVYQYRPIHVSCYHLQLNVLKELVENWNAYIDAANTHGFTPLHILAQRMDTRALDFLHYLLERGANVDLQDNDMKTPLMHAVLRDNIRTVKVLISLGADRLCVDGYGNNLLHVTGNVNVARLLLEDVSAKALQKRIAFTLLTSKNAKGETPLDIAERRFANCEDRYERQTLHYVFSFSKRQVAVVTSPKSQSQYERCSQLNPYLSPIQRHYVFRIYILLKRSELVDDLIYHVLGFLSPLDLMND